MSRMVVTVVLALCACSCEQTENAGCRELPEDPRLRARLTGEELLRDAKRSLESDRQALLRESSINILGVAQAEYALRRLGAVFDHRAEGPVTIAAHAGTDARGELYLSVYALVPSREASCIRLVMSDAEGDTRAIVVDLHPEHKALEYVVLHYFSAQQQPWRTIQAMIPRNSAYRIDARSSAKVPLPYERDEVTCVVAIEDRCGRLGNFVPVVEYNAAP